MSRATHFYINSQQPNWNAKCGRLKVEQITGRRTEVTCGKCLAAMDRELPTLKSRVTLLKQILSAKRKLRRMAA